MSSNAGATGGLIEALAGHVRELSAKIGERSVLRGDGLDRAKAYVRGAFEAAGLTVTEQAYEYGDSRVANLIASWQGAPSEREMTVGDSFPSRNQPDEGADRNLPYQFRLALARSRQ